jgi:hypothetical protein
MALLGLSPVGPGSGGIILPAETKKVYKKQNITSGSSEGLEPRNMFLKNKEVFRAFSGVIFVSCCNHRFDVLERGHGCNSTARC